MGLDRQHFQLLAAIADRGQLGAAARSLHLSPSAASHRVREAERRLGVPLIEIEGRVARLTPAGRLLAATARLTERQLNQAEQASRWLHHGGGVDRLRVGVGSFDLLDWHQRLFESTEEIGVHSVDLVSVPSGTEHRALRNGEIDLTIVASVEPPRSDDDGWTELADDHLVAVLPPGFETESPDVFGPRDVAGSDYLAFSFEPLEGWELDRFLMPAEAQPRSLRRVDRLSAVMSIIGRGGGRSVSIQPSLAVANALIDHGVTVLPLTADLALRWYAVTGSSPSTAASTAVARLQSGARTHAVKPPSITNSDPVQ